MSEEAKKLFQKVNERVKSSEYRRILDYLIKQQMLEIENIEVRVNLQFMEKLNKMLMGEISKFKAILKENNVFSENDHNYNYPERRMSRERLESIEEETVDSKYVFLFIIYQQL